MSTNAESRPVVVGVDGSPTMFLAVAWAVDFASSTSAPLRIVVAHHPDALEDELLAAGAPSDRSQPRVVRVAQQHADAAAAHARALDPHVHIESAALPGAPTTILLEEAQRSALMVLGSPQLGRLHRALTGSTVAAATSE